MRNTQKVISFVSKWKDFKYPSQQILFDYKKICKDLLYEEEDIVLSTISVLKKNIKLWAKENSPVYSKLNKPFIEKKDLIYKDFWYVKGINSRPMATSGSTTGVSFSYLRWEDFLYFIECDNHYDLVLDEFQIKEEPNIMFFLDIGIKIKNTIEVRSNPENFMERHGRKRRPQVHYVDFEEFRNNRDSFFRKLTDHIKSNKIDVLLTSGPNLNSLCNYLENNNINLKISALLSNTNEKLLEGTVNYIKTNNSFDHICDHMRCWDGGATFFTCREENYHLLDNIAWCEEGEDNRLISTDYFSLASPFVRYWNGDFCKIESEFKRCRCGRLYRNFEFLTNRPFMIKGKNILTIKEKLKSFKEIKEVRCSKEFIEIISRSLISEEDQKNIYKDINNLLNSGEKNERDLIKIKFLVENYG